MKTKTTRTADLQAEQFDDLTWAMSVMAGTEEGDSNHAEWMLNTLATKGCNEVIRLAASSALFCGKLATA
jgi:hypothetical protein